MFQRSEAGSSWRKYLAVSRSWSRSGHWFAALLHNAYILGMYFTYGTDVIQIHVVDRDDKPLHHVDFDGFMKSCGSKKLTVV